MEDLGLEDQDNLGVLPFEKIGIFMHEKYKTDLYKI